MKKIIKGDCIIKRHEKALDKRTFVCSQYECREKVEHQKQLKQTID